MICPKCGAEYRGGTGRCESCGFNAIDASSPAPTRPVPLAKLVSTTDVGFLPFLKSLLESAEIPYVIQGEGAFGLFPVGPFAGGLSGGGALRATVLVPADRLEEARALLEEKTQSLDGCS